MKKALSNLKSKIGNNLKTGKKRTKLIALAVVLGVVGAGGLVAYAISNPNRVGNALLQGSTGTDIAVGDGIYYVDHDITITGSSGTSALTIIEGANVTLVIDEGVTLTCIGGDAVWGVGGSDGTAGAGIRLPYGSTLTVYGSGSIVATGGSGYDGTNGSKGTNGKVSSKVPGNILQKIVYGPAGIRTYTMYGGNGGDGGHGACAGGAGIGDVGSYGGEGGEGGNGAYTKHEKTLLYEQDKSGEEGETGEMGTDGDAGGTSSGMGTLNIFDSVSVTATSGTSGTYGTGGAGGEGAVGSGDSMTDAGVMGLYTFRLKSEGGAGGGGGGAAGASPAVGMSGAGGGGGGGGQGGYYSAVVNGILIVNQDAIDAIGNLADDIGIVDDYDDQGDLESRGSKGTRGTTVRGGYGGQVPYENGNAGRYVTGDGSTKGRDSAGGLNGSTETSFKLTHRGTVNIAPDASLNGATGTNISLAETNINISRSSSTKTEVCDLYSTLDGYGAQVNAVRKVGVTLGLTGEGSTSKKWAEWTQNLDVYTTDDSGNVSILNNRDYYTGDYSSTYEFYLPVDSTYTVTIEEAGKTYETGRMLITTASETNRFITINAVMTIVRVYKDDELVEKGSQSVAIYQDGVMVLDSEEVSRGTFVLPRFYNTARNANNTYEVYVSGQNTEMTLSTDSATTAQLDVNYYETTVQVYCDDVLQDGSRVDLYRDGVNIRNLREESTGTFSQYIIYNTQDLSKNIYDIYVDYLDAKQSVTTDQTRAARVDFYTVTVNLQKDNEPWSDVTAKIFQGVYEHARMTESDTEGTYTAKLLRDPTITADSVAYKLYVYGANSSDDTGYELSENNKEVTVNYYTFTFQRNWEQEFGEPDGEYVTYTKRVIQEGGTCERPVDPFRYGYTFLEWCNIDDTADDKVGDSYNFDTAITEPTQIIADWQEPTISINEIVRCDENGNIDGSGFYYRMSNLAITGYPGGSNEVMNEVILDFRYVEGINLTELQDTLTALHLSEMPQEEAEAIEENYDTTTTGYYLTVSNGEANDEEENYGSRVLTEGTEDTDVTDTSDDDTTDGSVSQTVKAVSDAGGWHLDEDGNNMDDYPTTRIHLKLVNTYMTVQDFRDMLASIIVKLMISYKVLNSAADNAFVNWQDVFGSVLTENEDGMEGDVSKFIESTMQVTVFGITQLEE